MRCSVEEVRCGLVLGSKDRKAGGMVQCHTGTRAKVLIPDTHIMPAIPVFGKWRQGILVKLTS